MAQLGQFARSVMTGNTGLNADQAEPTGWKKSKPEERCKGRLKATSPSPVTSWTWKIVLAKFRATLASCIG